MEENKKEQFNRVDELLENTSAENRIKFNEDDAIDLLSSQESEPVEQQAEPEALNIEANNIPEADFEDEDEEDSGSVCIIDETSTTIELSDSTEAYQTVNEEKPRRQKKDKEKLKFNALQIVLISVVGVLLLWCIAFTADHTIAAQGYSPIFSVQTQTYEDGSASFKGLGYKIQFRFDANGNLTQKCVPIWKDGPNDTADKQESGASFQ